MMQHQPRRPHPESLPRRDPPHRISKALLAIPLLAATGWLTYKSRGIPRDPPLPDALPGERLTLESAEGRLSYYRAGPSRPTEASEPPLLLVHSVNAAGSAYEVGPVFGPLAATRAVYALELPGFGFSERRQRLYTPQLMTSAVLAMAAQIRADHAGARVDALALSLSCEFLARAAVEAPDAFGHLALISPTGFDRREPRDGPPGSNRGMPALYKTFTGGPWSRGLFNLLTSRVSIRYFLEKTWGSKAIDEGLLEYDYLSTHQEGAQHAPYSFVSGYLFSRDISRIYDSLGHPIWMVHGTRGDFTDYSGKARVEGRANWTIEVFDTGALPHFEEPHRFNANLQKFLATHAG